MNTERYVWPVIIAAGLHGALLLCSSKNPPPSPGEVEAPLVLPGFPPLEMMDPPEPAVGEAGGRADSLPSLPDFPKPLENPRDITIPVSAPSDSINPVITLPANPIGPIGPPALDIGTGGIPDTTSLDRIPRATVQTSPNYPPAMRTSATDGTVTVEFVVDTTGRVVTAEAMRWTHREFVDPAVRAVLRWRFEPGTINGRKVSFRMAVPIEYNAAR